MCGLYDQLDYLKVRGVVSENAFPGERVIVLFIDVFHDLWDQNYLRNHLYENGDS